MNFPEYEQMADALLWYIYSNGGTSYSLRPKMIYEALADLLNIDERDRRKPRTDGYSGTQWENRAQWTRQKLINEGKLDGRTRGVWQLTQKSILHASRVEF